MVSRGKRSISLITYISERKKNEMHNKRKDAQNECAKQYTTFKIFKKEIRRYFKNGDEFLTTSFTKMYLK